MKKSKKIIRDLKNLKGNKIFGYYNTRNQTESRNLYMSVFDIVRALANYEIDFKKRYGVDYDDFIYDDKQGNWGELDMGNGGDNSCNWSSSITFNFNFIEIDGEEFITIKFHRYGDVRGNYSDYMVLNIDKDNFYEIIQDETTLSATVSIKGNDYSIETNCMHEHGCYDVYDCNMGDYIVENSYIDIYNEASIKSITKGLRAYLKSEGLI